MVWLPSWGCISMSVISKLAMLGASGGGDSYWVGTYTSSGVNTENYVDSVYSDDFDLLVFSQLVSGTYEYFIVDGVTGDFIRAEKNFNSGVSNYAEPADIHLTKTSNGEVWVGTKADGRTGKGIEFIRLGASGVTDRSSFYANSFATSMFGLADKDKNFYIFGDNGAGASFKPTINTTLNLGTFPPNQSAMNSAAYDAGQNKLYAFYNTNGTFPVIVQMDVASNGDLTNPVGSKMKNFTTYQNPGLKLRNGPSGSLYYAFYSGNSTWDVARVSKTHPFNKVSGTSVLTGFSTTNPASATTSSNQYSRMHYDPVNDRVYIARDFAVCCLSSNLSSVHWVIETNLSAISATSTLSGDVILSGADYTNNFNVASRIDADASQVSNSLTSPISGFSWKRSSGSITTTSNFTNQSVSAGISKNNQGGYKLSVAPSSPDSRNYSDNVASL
jgi:hypothetical protein